MSPKSLTGYSLFDLMITVSIISILLAIGIPGLSGVITSNRLVAQSNELNAGLSYARTESITKNQHVIVCKSRDQLVCSQEAAWSDGWLIFIDENRNNKQEEDETLLLKHQALHQSVLLHYRGFGSPDFVVFRPDGSTTSNGTFSFCDANNPDQARSLIINRVGRIRSLPGIIGGEKQTCRNQ